MQDSNNILALLNSNDEEQIREGARIAYEEKMEGAIPLLVKLLGSAKPGIIEAVERSLQNIGGAKTVQALIPLLRSDDASLRNASMELLRTIGSDDTNSLFRLLYDDDADIRIFASDIIGKTNSPSAVPPLATALLSDPEVNVRYQAAVSLGDLGFQQAVDSLIKALKDEEWVQFAVIEALVKIRAESSLQPLMKALSTSTPLVASMILEAFGEIGNIKAVPILMDRLSKAPPFLRSKIAKSIVKLLGADSITLISETEQNLLRETLLHSLADVDEDHSTQQAALTGLGVLGDEQATRAIMKYALSLDQDRDQDRIEDAVKAMSDIGFNQALAEIINDGSNEAKELAALTMLSTSSHDGLSMLEESFWKCERNIQRLYMDVLAAKCNKNDLDFFLRVIDKHDDGSVLKAALSYLASNADYASAGQVMLQLTEHPYNDVKEAAIETCIKINSSEMIGHFIEMAHSEDTLRRMMGIYAIGRQDADGHIGILSEALEDSEPEVRRLAVESLSECCSLDSKYLDHITPRIFDESRDVRLAVIDALGRCANDSVNSMILKALDDEDIWVRARAIEALARRNALDSVPYLISTLKSPSQLLVIKSIEALATIGGKEAFRAVLHMVASDDPEVQQTAEMAVDHMRGRERR